MVGLREKGPRTVLYSLSGRRFFSSCDKETGNGDGCHFSSFPRVTWNLVVLWIFLEHVTLVMAMSGHVCTRARAETYTVATNQAFVCQERYTTSCGHLDWRRCTKYRVQTCFTPGKRYATRYREEQVCCPGWSDAGGGSCTTPLCQGQCQNGGTCANVAGAPGCVCTAHYYGDKCQYSHNTLPEWGVVLIVLTSLLVLCGIVVTAYCLCRKRQRTSPHPHQSVAANAQELRRTREATRRPGHDAWTPSTRQSPHMAQRETDLNY